MAVNSTSFGAVRLTKDDAHKFRAQMTYGRPKKEVASTYARGKKLVKSYASKGYVILKTPV